MTAVPERCLPRGERQVKSFFEDLHCGLLDAVVTLQSRVHLGIAQAEKLRHQLDDLGALSASVGMLNNHASSFGEAEGGPTWREAAVQNLRQLREDCKTARNQVVTCMWALCVLGVRGTLQAVAPVFAKLVQVQKELASEAVKCGRLCGSEKGVGGMSVRALLDQVSFKEGHKFR